MRCPNCGQPEFYCGTPCPACSYQADPRLLERLSNLRFMLSELDRWSDFSTAALTALATLRDRYSLALRNTERELGLRAPVLSASQTRQARDELGNIQHLLIYLQHWVRQGVIDKQYLEKLENGLREKALRLDISLVDAPSTPTLSKLQQTLNHTRYRLIALQEWQAQGYIKSEADYQKAIAELNAQIEKFEITLGLRPAPPAPQQMVVPSAPKAPSRPKVASLKLPRPSREKLVETLLSERTLQAILFLGATLLFAAAVSLVVWNWDVFPPWLQVTFLALNTGLFYFLGWYARGHMNLRGSGITLSAVASLLVPLDFYAIYLSRGFPPQLWPQVWMLASLVCLGAYLLTTYLVQAEFFGYLVGLAAGSTLAAAMKLGGIHPHAWQAGLSALALLLGLIAEGLMRRKPARWSLLAVPLWRIALAGASVILLLASGWLLTGRVSTEIYRAALALDWWLAGALFVLAARRYPGRMLALLAGGSFPVALVFTQDVLFTRMSASIAWHALGLALLVPIYLVVGRQLVDRAARATSRPALQRAYARTALGYAVALAVAAALWSLLDPRVAAIVHPLLAGVVALAAGWWQRPRLAYLSSLLLLSGSTAVIASRGATLAQIGLAWGLVAVLHAIAAIRLEGYYATTNQPGSRRPYAAPVYAAGWLIAGLALLPPLFMRERGILTYALGNWIAINAWLALQAESRESVGLLTWLSGTRLPVTRRSLSPLLFHWVAALPLLPWLWLVWTNHNNPSLQLGWLYTLLGWGALFLGARLLRVRRAYFIPWGLLAHLAVPLGILLVLNYDTGVWGGAALLLGAVFYFSAAHLQRRRVWLFIAGLILPLGWVLELNWFGLVTGAQLVGVSVLPLAYEIAAYWLGQRRQQKSSFYQSLRAAALVVAAVVFVRGMLWISEAPNDDVRLLWAAGASFLLCLQVALRSWLSFERGSAHLAAWLGVLSGGLVAAAYSRGSGRSAAAAALLAVVYILAERGLYWAATHRQLTWGWQRSARKAWRLYRLPLLVCGWAVSAITIILALWRNLVVLGGGRERETWSILALLLLTGLYALAARLFRRQKYAGQFAWFAAFLIFIPWTLLTHQGWYLWPSPAEDIYALSWAVLALAELLVGVILAKALVPDSRLWALAPMLIAHLILPFALAWGASDTLVSSITLGMGVAFYLSAVWIDTWYPSQAGLVPPSSLVPPTSLVPPVSGGTPHPAPREVLPGDRRRASGESIHAERGYQVGQVGLRQVKGKIRFLYPAVFLIPVWAIYLLQHFAPDASSDAFAWLLMVFPLPALYLGRRLEYRWQAQLWPAYNRPLYRLAYITSLVAIFMAVPADRLTMIAALLLATLVASLAAWMFQRPGWLFPACAAFAGATLVAVAEWHLAPERQGWALIAVSGLYLLLARRLEGVRSQRNGVEDRLTYTAVLQICALVLVALSLPFSSLDRLGAALGYAAAAALCALLAFWLRQAWLLTPAAFLAAIPYAMGVLELRQRTGWPGNADLGLVAWPGILLLFGLATLLDRRLGIEPDKNGQRPGAFPWLRLAHWPAALFARLGRWWALPLYTLALGGAAASILLSLPSASKLALDAALCSALFLLAVYYFRLRIWLVAALGAAQISLLAVIAWLAPQLDAGQVVLAFAPVVWLTALMGLFVQRSRQEAGLVTPRWFWGWSRPFYLIVALDLWFGQILCFLPYSASRWITLSNALLLGVFASAWSSTFLAYLSPLTGLWALILHLSFIQAFGLDWPPALALLGLVYGVGGYLLRYFSTPEPRLPSWLDVWPRPLRRFAWGLTILSLLLAFYFGTNVFVLAFRAIFSLPLLTALDLWRVQMYVSVLSLAGLLVLTAAVVERRRRLGYGALALLLVAWSLELLLVWGWREVQWYAIPAGLYLLGIGYLEWTQGGPAARNLARWVDRAALLLLLGSAFWQSLGPQGWRYALLMGLESLLILWWGSARRLRRFLYAGVIGMTVDVAGQLVEPLLSANRWIVFGVAGVLLVGLAMLVERRMDAIVTMSQEMRARLERWQ